VKFLVDMPLSPALARWLAARGHDAVHASVLGLDRAADTEILARAAQDECTVVTADLDYPRLLALAGAEGPSLILFRGGHWSEADVVARMQHALDRLGESDIARSIIVVDRTRVRRRRLPIA
jgi:predicted nuclease of predicted toxin-antitoxin system